MKDYYVLVTTSLPLNKMWVTQTMLSWHQSKLFICFLLFLMLYKYIVLIGPTQHG